MKKKIIIVAFLIISGAAFTMFGLEEVQDRQVVENIVKVFGGRLQNVSLLAPRDALIQSIKENYGELVVNNLMNEWIGDPVKAPGRLVSSPWPDHIEIVAVKRLSGNEYQITGDIIEVTSVRIEESGFMAKQPVTIIIQKINNHWLITRLNLGAYKTLTFWQSSTDDASGLIFDYPTSLNTKFVYFQSWPPELTITNQAFSCVETSPISSLPERVMERVISSKLYCIKAISEGAAGSVYTDYTYSTMMDNKVANLNFILRYSQCDNYSDSEKTQCIEERTNFNLDVIVAEIMTSIRTQ
jgi:hypothetical protein